MKLDLACGRNRKEGFIGIDISGDADIILDLSRFPWPMENDFADEIWCSHYVEHTDDMIGFMNECCRILKPGACMTVNAPYYTSIRAHSDPDHKRSISENTFDYFDALWRRRNRMDHVRITADFEILQRVLVYSPEWSWKTAEEIEYARKHYWNVATDIQVKLRKR